MPARGYILELGGGPGKNASFLLQNGYSVCFTDGAPGMISEAERLHPELIGKTQLVCLPSKLPFSDDSFDGIVALAMLMHLHPDELPEVVVELHRVLKTNGILYFTFPSKRNDLDEQSYDSKRTWYNQLTKEQWVEIVEAQGFVLSYNHLIEDGFQRPGIEFRGLAFRKI